MHIFFRLLLFSIFLTVHQVHAQNAVMRGYVRDASDGQPLQGVNVILTNDEDALIGSASDRDGFFALSGITPGRYYITASFIGFSSHRDTLDFTPGDINTYNIEMQLSDDLLDEMVVESEREGAGAAGLTGGLQSITPREIALIPAPDVSGDLANYLSTLPGVVSSGDQGGQLFIRGGEPTQNQVILDGMTIFQPFHLIGFYSAFPSNILNVTDVYAGGFGAKYGGRLSSVIDISTRNGNKRRIAGEVSAAPFISAVLLEGPILSDKVSGLISGRFSVIDQGAERILDRPLPYDFNDQFAKIHVDFSQNSQASVSALRSYDNGIIGTPEDFDAVDTTRNEVKWTSQAIGARYILLPKRIPVQAELLMSYSSIENTLGQAANPSRRAITHEVNASANITHFNPRVDISWGIHARFSELNSELGGVFQNIMQDAEFISEAGGYMSLDLKGIAGLSFQPGVRISSFPSKGRTFIEPRIRLTYDLDIHRLSMAGGIYHQEIVGLTDRRDAGDIFTAWTTSPFGKVPRAIHGLVGYQIQPFSWLQLAVEGFYKNMNNLSIAEWSSFPRFTTRLQSADGNVIGLDSRIEISKGAFYGFVNYGYARVRYQAQQTEIEYWFGNSEYEFSPPHDRQHQLNTVGSLTWQQFRLSARWQFGSGLPFSQALGFDEFILLSGPTDIFEEYGDTRVLYSYPYGGRLPSYHRLDVSLEYTFNISQNTNVSILASVTNAYDRTNLFYIDLFTLERLDQLPFIPAVGLKLQF